MKKYTNFIILWFILIFSFLFVYNQAYHSTKVDYVREIVLSLMAASITIIITSILLRQQTRSEELKDNHAEVFRKKFEVYSNFIASLIESLKIEDDSSEHPKQLEYNLYQLLLFVENPKTFDVLYKIVKSSLVNNSREDIGLALLVLRNELGIHAEDKQLAKEKFWKELGCKMNVFFSKAEDGKID